MDAQEGKALALYLLSDEDFDRHLDEIAQAEVQAIDPAVRPEGIPPKLIVHTHRVDGLTGPTQERLVFVLGFDSDDAFSNRGELFEVLGEKLYSDPSYRRATTDIFFVSEAWVATGATPDEVLTPPEERLDAMECLIIQGLTMDKRLNTLAMRIRRDNDERITHLDPYVKVGCSQGGIVRVFTGKLPNDLSRFFFGIRKALISRDATNGEDHE